MRLTKTNWYIPATIITILIILTVFPYAWNACIRETNDVEDYLDGSYIKFNGGEEAKHFFEEYARTDSYKDIGFNYRDAGKLIELYKYKTAFALDVYYEAEDFDRIFDAIVFDTDIQESYCSFGEILVYNLIKNEPLYLENSAMFFIDKDNHRIIYALLLNHSPDCSGTDAELFMRTMRQVYVSLVS